MKKICRFKRGDTFVLNVTLTNSAGEPIVGASAGLLAQIRTIADVLIDTTVVSEISSGVYQLLVEDTTTWDTDVTYYMDIQYTDSEDIIVSSDTIAIPVIKDVSYV